MNLDRAYWQKHFKSNIATKKTKLVNSDLLGAGLVEKQISMVSPMQQEINKNEKKIAKKRKKITNSKIFKKKRKVSKNKRIKRTSNKKKAQTKKKRTGKRKVNKKRS